MATPRVPVQFVAASPRLKAAQQLAGGPPPGSQAGRLEFLCQHIARLCAAPVASLYALEGPDDLVLRGNVGLEGAGSEVRLKVGQGITGTAVESQQPVTVDDARLSAQYAYFPQLREERYPAFLAVPLRAGGRPRGALVLQRERGPFSEEDVLLALACAGLAAPHLADVDPAGVSLVLSGAGNGRGRALGQAHLASRSLPRSARGAAQGGLPALEAAFEAERAEARALLAKARSAVRGPLPVLDELAILLEDARLAERAEEHVQAGLEPALALERIAAEYAKALGGQGALARRALEAEAFLGGVAHRLAKLERERLRRGEVLVGVQLPALEALRAWSSGAKGAVCAAKAQDGLGVAALTALGLPVVSGVGRLFERVRHGARIAVDAEKGEVLVNPTAAQVAGWKGR